VDAPEQHGVSVVCCWLLEMEWAAAEPLKLANCFAGVACKIPTGLAAGAGGVPKCAGKAAAVAGAFPRRRGKLLLLRGKLPQRRGNRPLLREGMTPTRGNSAPVRGN